MVKCQVCNGVGHSALECPSRSRLGKRGHGASSVCQVCNQPGHTAKECEADGGGGGEESSEDEDDESSGGEASEADSATPSETGSCYLCHAAKGDECSSGCKSETARAARIARQAEAAAAAKRRKLEAKQASAGSAGSAAVPSPERVAGPSTDEILKLKETEVARLDLKQVIMLPECLLPWINGPKKLADRKERHRQVFETLKVLILDDSTDAGSGDRAKVSPLDLERARRELERMKQLTAPDVAPGKRIATLSQDFGYEMIAFKDARVHGWPAVRQAQKIFRSEAMVSRPWAQALSKGVAAAKAHAASSGAASGARSDSPRGTSGGGGGKRRRGGKGGKGGGGGDKKGDGKSGGGGAGRS